MKLGDIKNRPKAQWITSCNGLNRGIPKYRPSSSAQWPDSILVRQHQVLLVLRNLKCQFRFLNSGSPFIEKSAPRQVSDGAISGQSVDFLLAIPVRANGCEGPAVRQALLAY